MDRTTYTQRLAMACLPLAATLFTPAMTIAQVDRSKPPKPAAAPIVQLGKHFTFVLDNGMRVIVVENHKLPMVSVQVKFDIEPFLQGEKAGFIDLAGDLLGSGTARHKKEDIDEQVDRLGASLNTATDGLYASCLTRGFSELFNLAFEITTSATFPPDEFEKAKKRMLSGIKSRQDDADAISEQVGRVLTYGKGHPYGEVTTEASVGKVTRTDVFTYYQRFFRPQQGYLVFVGDITPNDVREMTGRTFGTWQGAQVTSSKDPSGVEVVEGLGPVRVIEKQPVPRQVRTMAIVDKPGAAQSVVRAVFPVHLHPWDDDAITAQVLNTILGGGVFNARLMQNLREDKAYTYGAYSQLTADRYTGSFAAGASVRTEVTDSAIVELMDEISGMLEREVTGEELALAKSHLAGNFARSLEDPRTIARFALNTYLNKMKEDHYRTYLQRLDTVTAEGVMALANQLLVPDRAMVLVVGDKERVANKLAPLSFDRGVGVYDMNGDPWKEKATPLPAGGITAQQVIDNYLAACGGRPAIAGIRDLRIDMTANMQGTAVTMTQWYATPNKYASEMRNGSMLLQRSAFDGIRGFSDGPMGPHELVDLELEEIQQNAIPFAEMKYADFHNKLLLNSTVDLDGREAYKITAMTESGGIFYEYYDTQTGFKLRRVEPKNTEMGNITVTTNFKDYRPEGGIQFAHLVEQNMGMELVFTVNSVAVNKGVPASVFTVE